MTGRSTSIHAAHFTALTQEHARLLSTWWNFATPIRHGNILCRWIRLGDGLLLLDSGRQALHWLPALREGPAHASVSTPLPSPWAGQPHSPYLAEAPPRLLPVDGQAYPHPQQHSHRRRPELHRRRTSRTRITQGSGLNPRAAVFSPHLNLSSTQVQHLEHLNPQSNRPPRPNRQRKGSATRSSARQTGSEAADARSSQQPGNPVSKIRFVPSGGPDPAKREKRTDGEQDKERKDLINAMNGTCFGCKRSKRQCDGDLVCKGCHSKGKECIRTCDSCWQKNKPCKASTPCSYCRESAIECTRKSVPRINVATGSPSDPPSLPQSTLEVNDVSDTLSSHSTMRAECDTGALVPWRNEIASQHALYGEHRSRPTSDSQSLTSNPPDIPSINYPLNPPIGGAESDIGPVETKACSQQTTDDPTTSGALSQGSTKASSTSEIRVIEQKLQSGLEVQSSTSEHLDDATWAMGCDSPDRQPQAAFGDQTFEGGSLDSLVSEMGR